MGEPFDSRLGGSGEDCPAFFDDFEGGVVLLYPKDEGGGRCLLVFEVGKVADQEWSVQGVDPCVDFSEFNLGRFEGFEVPVGGFPVTGTGSGVVVVEGDALNV